MLHQVADPTAALAMIRVVILEWENADAEQVPATVVLAYLVDKLDTWLCRKGSLLPSQWTGPEGEGWQGYNRYTCAEITDPGWALDRVRTLVRQVQEGKAGQRVSDRLFSLVAGLDKLATDEQAVPRQWQTAA
ncbi:hypothetical protein FXN61_35385 [Lentzea sp. PSKA42]|uniref:Uncharacterized protein n=1 Tax=Lentzea indica TaxID=2604800 RepID=A0ABX1FRW5_9PSEU|nr:hypothetical protein [Lentzea indica]NKE61761.1 hypothetical protein [Lentzea indica]